MHSELLLILNKNKNMNTLTINYRYIVGQIIYFMYKNEIRKGIICNIEIDIETKRLATYLTKKIINKVISIFSKDYPFSKIKIRYTLDLVSKDGDFESSPHMLFEEDIFENKKEIIKSIEN